MTKLGPWERYDSAVARDTGRRIDGVVSQSADRDMAGLCAASYRCLSVDN